MAQPGAPTFEVPVQMPQKPQWECKIETQPKDAKGFTVGEVFQMNCSGSSLSMQEPFKIINPEKLQYSLVYLKTLKQSENELQFLATSYAAAPVSHPFIHVSDAAGGGFISQAMQIQTQSVLDPKQPPPQSPYGPIQPMAISWPYWIFFAILLVVAVLIGWSAILFRRIMQRRNLEKNIRKFQSPLGSYHQFSKDLRLLKRGVVFSQHADWSESQTQAYLEKLNEVYRMFILREYTVPALSWSTSQIAKHVQKKNKMGYDFFKGPFLKAFKELEGAQSHISQLKPKDCEQITQLCWTAVDLMWKHKAKTRISQSEVTP